MSTYVFTAAPFMFVIVFWRSIDATIRAPAEPVGPVAPVVPAGPCGP
ncbi:MAG: hypothetical protein H0V79_09610 [Actinobacteria bacterium]|nr:hypothetical protein [Actinomycetota bacterium]